MDEKLRDLVDLDCYPIHSLESPEGKRLLKRCRAELDEKALCALHDFVYPSVRERMVEEVTTSMPGGFYYQQQREAYDDDGRKYPEGHPRTRTHPCRYDQIMNDQIPWESLIRKLYGSRQLVEFIRQVLGHETFYPAACPYLSLTVQVTRDGDANGWHFDGNDAVFSLLLQQPEAGGEFEYVPYVRSQENENYDGVSRVFDDSDQYAQRPAIREGTFTLFKGDLSLHRVREIRGNRPRIIALFCYDQRPDKVFDPVYVQQVRSRGVRAG
ncbi:MAG: hypothetical protein O7F16_09855 [Acidobacteria bacterium]|nr:hypothetical protein [Acidobacteriota bacterium]